LSIFWVIYGHDFLIRFRAISNIADYGYIIESVGFVTLAPSAYFAVDVFFFLGGFLAAFMVIEKLRNMKKITPAIIPSMWLHRFLRIWPTFAFCLLVYYKLSVYFFSGPIWSMYINETQYCDGTFWRNLLFIDNFFTHSKGGLDYCYGWGWYLSNDF
jgi:peptidoglycan/LPS O-acetylase OafA/YrhL